MWPERVPGSPVRPIQAKPWRADGKYMTTTRRASHLTWMTTVFLLGPALIAPLALWVGPGGMAAIAALLILAAMLLPTQGDAR